MAPEERTEPARTASETLRVAERRAPVGPLIAIAVIASALGIALALIIDWFPTAASTQADDVDTLYDVLMIASVPMFVLVCSTVLYCVYRFRMRPGEENMDGPPIHGNTRLEMIWTIIPACLLLGLCTYSYVVLRDAEKAPAATGAQKELNVRVVGQQFTWTFFYEDPKGGSKEIASPQLYLPKDRSVRFTVQSKDVLHDFWVPEFRWKIDAVPGINTHYRVTPTRLGDYPVVCAELCGLGHATMRQTAHVIKGTDFNSWLDKKASGGAAGGAQGQGGNAQGGGNASAPDAKALFTSNGCGGCHKLAAAGTQGGVGPDLDQVLKGKDAAFIKQSIVDPNAVIAKGFQPGIMPPNFGQTLQPSELDALVKYLEEKTNP